MKGVDAIRNPPTAWVPPCCNTRRPKGVRIQSVTITVIKKLSCLQTADN